MKAAKESRTVPPGLAAGSAAQAPASLHARLQERRAEIEEAALTRVYSVSDPGEVADPEYVQGLRAAVTAAIDYGLAGIEGGEIHPPPIPTALLVQARVAARNGISLDTVLRRYFAGYALLADFLIEEAEEGGLLPGADLKHLLRAQAPLFDRLVEAVSEQHCREMNIRLDSVEQRRAKHVKKLLAGELIDAPELSYELDAHHLAVVGAGPGARAALRDLATALDYRLLLVLPGDGTVWAWLGSREKVDPSRLQPLAGEVSPAHVSLAAGEPGKGLAGWRLTHRQARAALPIALHSSKRFIRYADVALLAASLSNDLLATSLRELYLDPLSKERDGGEVLRETLRAYFAAERNVSSAAAALGVNRHTVSSRLRTIEEHLGRSLSTCAAEMDAALRLKELDLPARPIWP